MKILSIAFKDLQSSLRSGFALVMMFVLPLLITGLFYFAFGGIVSGDGADLTVTKVQVVNLDRAQSFAAGESLVRFLQDARLAKLVAVTVAPNEASARQAVDSQQAALAVIIPPDFSSTVTSEKNDATTAVTLYQDPTLKLGPGLVRELIGQFLDNFNGSRIAAGTLAEQSSKHGVTLDSATLQGAAMQYSMWTQAQSQRSGEPLDLQPPPSKAATDNPLSRLIGGVMAGMMLFFVFFTGANAAESIVTEDEEGTLARLFTTPTARSMILAGKFVSVFLMLLIQVAVLILVSALIFGINWGELVPVGLMILSTVIVAAGFGVLLLSFVKNSRQSGPLVGGVLAITGLAGGLMTTGFGELPPFFVVINLLTPQGWVLKGWTTTLAGGGIADILLPLGVSVAFGATFFAAGTLVFRRRFA